MKRTGLYIMIIALFSLIMSGCNDEVNIEKRIKEYCNSNKEIQLKNVTDFERDVAYLDYQVYGQGQNLKKLYGIEGNFEGLNSEEQFAIAFCKNGKLVKYAVCSSFDLMFGEEMPSDDKTTAVISPDTVFKVQCQSDSQSKSSELHLLPKQ